MLSGLHPLLVFEDIDAVLDDLITMRPDVLDDPEAGKTKAHVRRAL